MKTIKSPEEILAECGTPFMEAGQNSRIGYYKEAALKAMEAYHNQFSDKPLSFEEFYDKECMNSEITPDISKWMYKSYLIGFNSSPLPYKKVEELRKAADEREVLIQAFDKITKEFEGRHWLMEGRGCYPYNDDRYKEEVRYIMDAFNAIEKDVWRQIKSGTFEYKNRIIAEYSLLSGNRVNIKTLAALKEAERYINAVTDSTDGVQRLRMIQETIKEGEIALSEECKQQK